MTISQTLVNDCIERLQLAVQQTRREKAGEELFYIKRILNEHHMTLVGLYKLYLINRVTEHTPEPNAEPYLTNRVTEHSPEPDDEPFCDETDEWILPWINTILEKEEIISDKDYAFLFKMAEKRHGKPRSKATIQWVFDCSCRYRVKVPREFYQIMKEHVDD